MEREPSIAAETEPLRFAAIGESKGDAAAERVDDLVAEIIERKHRDT